MQILLWLLVIVTPAIPSEWKAWRLEEAAPGVHVFVAPPGVTPIVSGNTTAIIGDDGVVIVDTGQLPSISRQQIAALKQLTKQPVRFLVNTHWHGDHWIGNGEWLAAYPNASVIATRKTRQLMIEKASQFLNAEYQKKTLVSVEALLDGPNAPKPGTMERAYYELGRAQLVRYAAEFDATKIVHPNVTFDQDLTITIGKRVVELKFLGRGNTSGDLVAYVPDAKLVATGDLVVAPYPYAIGSHLHEWHETLGKLKSLGATVYVPGHGPVMRDTKYIDVVRELLAATEGLIRAAKQQGKSLDELSKTIDLSAHRKQLCGEDAWCAFGFDGVYTHSILRRGWREAASGPLPDED